MAKSGSKFGITIYLEPGEIEAYERERLRRGMNLGEFGEFCVKSVIKAIDAREAKLPGPERYSPVLKRKYCRGCGTEIPRGTRALYCKPCIMENPDKRCGVCGEWVRVKGKCLKCIKREAKIEK